MKKGISGHQSANVTTTEWLTPEPIIRCLGEFDLDPCAPTVRPWSMAKTHYTIDDNGLLLPWEGRVWLNPPYGNEMGPWLKLMAQHGNGISLIFNRTDRNDVQEWCLAKADSMFLLRQRLSFYDINGKKAPYNGGAPNVFFAYGEANSQALEESGLPGAHVPLRASRLIVVGITRSWKYVVSVAFGQIDGPAHLQAIYSVVQEMAPDKTENNPHWKEKIRQTVQKHATRVTKGTYTI